MKRDNAAGHPRLLVYTTMFPHGGQPGVGVFIRERMLRVGQVLPMVIVVPVPWFPLQGLVRRWRPHFRPAAPRHEIQQGIEIYCPRFFSIPAIFKSLDGLFMAIGSVALLLRLRRRFCFDVIDAHFAYPDGYAASLLGCWLGLPVTITLRGTEVPMARNPAKRRLMMRAIGRATRVFSVSDSLKQHVVGLGADAGKITVVGNGVDTVKFQPVSKADARRTLSVPQEAPILISVGGLVERKGHHRVIECLPALLKRFPGLIYLIVGGASMEGDWKDRLCNLVAELGLERNVRFLGTLPQDELKVPLSAADIFVLSTRNEGWANVFLEAMACGLPVVTTDVGGNKEVINNEGVGMVVPFGDREALTAALEQALSMRWDKDAIIAHARANSWEGRVKVLKGEFERIYDACDDGVTTE